MGMDGLLRRLAAHDGVFMTHEAISEGLDAKAIRARVRSGEWHRVRHGAYCAGETWAALDHEGRRLLVARAAVRSAKSHVLASHTTAVDIFGTPVWDLPDLTHLTRTDGRAGRREAGIVQHRGLVTVEDMTIRHGWQLTSGTRTALDITTIADTERSLVVVNGLIHADETSGPLMDRRLATMTNWPDTLRSELVLRLADGRCESAGESRTMFLCWREGLPAPVPQYEIRDTYGRAVARVDFAWPELGVFLEFDGKVKYLKFLKEGESPSDAVVREKRREELVCGLTGWRCVRIVWADLNAPRRTAQRIRSTLQGEPWAA
jgi:hypothetical protein